MYVAFDVRSADHCDHVDGCGQPVRLTPQPMCADAASGAGRHYGSGRLPLALVSEIVLTAWTSSLLMVTAAIRGRGTLRQAAEIPERQIELLSCNNQQLCVSADCAINPERGHVTEEEVHKR